MTNKDKPDLQTLINLWQNPSFAGSFTGWYSQVLKIESIFQIIDKTSSN